MDTDQRYILAYARPGRGLTVEDQIERLRPLVLRDDDIYADRLTSKGVGSSDLDALVANLRPGDCVAVTSLDKVGRNRGTILGFLEGLQIKRVGIISLLDGIDDRQPSADQVVKLAAALGRAARYCPYSWPQRRVKAGGRKPALTPKQIKTLLTMRDDTSLTWREIARHFADNGRDVGVSTLRRYYAAAKTGQGAAAGAAP